MLLLVSIAIQFFSFGGPLSGSDLLFHLNKDLLYSLLYVLGLLQCVFRDVRGKINVSVTFHR